MSNMTMILTKRFKEGITVIGWGEGFNGQSFISLLLYSFWKGDPGQAEGSPWPRCLGGDSLLSGCLLGMKSDVSAALQIGIESSCEVLTLDLILLA